MKNDLTKNEKYTEVSGDRLIDKSHYTVGKRVQLSNSDDLVRGLHNKTGVIESVDTVLFSYGKEKLFVIKLDEPYISAPGWKMDYLQDTGTHFHFIQD